MSSQMQLPPKVRALILAVAAAGTVAVAVRAADLGSWNSSDLLAWVPLTGGIALAEQFPIRLSFRTERIAFSLTEAVWIGIAGAIWVVGILFAILGRVVSREHTNKDAFLSVQKFRR